MESDSQLDIHIDTARFFGDAVIPLLPKELQVVPGFRLLPGARVPEGWAPTPGVQNPYEDTAWRIDYADWSREFLQHRHWVWNRGERNTTFGNEERVKCYGDGKGNRGCPKYFGAMYGHIQEPRAAGSRTSSVWLPFIPYHFQLHQTDRFLWVINQD